MDDHPATTTTRPVVSLDPLLDPAAATALVDLCERFGRYRMYAEHEQIETPLSRGLAQRHDTVQNFLRTGGRRHRDEPVRTLAARTSYFREEYAYGGEPIIDGIESFLHHPGFVGAAREVHDRPVVEPTIVYANLLIPGQELTVHTDVPEFRGVNRKNVPQWLLVVMHHSALFDTWRLPIATGIAWFQDSDGGALIYWPDGPTAPEHVHPVHANSALVLDTDSVFHGVDPVGEVTTQDMPAIGLGTTLGFLGDRRWELRDATETALGTYEWDELRFSISWKAYCFRDDAERLAWLDHTDDLTEATVLEMLVADLRARELVDDRVAIDTDLGLLLIDEYIRFPTA
jgi:hypothetical protein